MTEKVEWSIGNRLLVMNTSPVAAKNAVSARTTGRMAARNAPNASSRIRTVTGMARISACEKSLPAESLAALPKLAVPNSSTRNPSCDFWTLATARSTGATRSIVCIMSPRTLNCTSAEWPSRETSIAPPRSSGERASETQRWPLTAWTVARSVWRNCGSRIVWSELWTSTVSSAVSP